MNWLTKIFDRRAPRSSHGKSSRRTARFCPSVETLEERRVMDIGSAPIYDMTELANQFTTRLTPTKLYLNFDGQATTGVAPFQSANRERDIQEVLFRSAEMFAPFNVQVVRLFGNDSLDNSTNGNTTIFIGDNPAYTTAFSNRTGAFTPWTSTDFASTGRPEAANYKHIPNSDPFDIAYVDPWAGFSSWSNQRIAQAVAHEAGHTFGLAHVLTAPSVDVMSYDATNSAFMNVTYNVTDLNFNGTTTASDSRVQPVWYSIDYGAGDIVNNIRTQNSYTTLISLLGFGGAADDFASVANREAVDPGFRDRASITMSPGTSRTGAIERLGDYDVFSFTAPRSGPMRLEIAGSDGSSLMPSAMVSIPLDQRTGGAGSILASQFDDDRDGDVEVTFNALSGVTYRLIVGARDSNSSGAYRVSLDAGAALGANPILSLQSLASSQNGLADSVDLQNSNGHFRLIVNGATVYSDRTTDLQSATVQGTSDFETFRVTGDLAWRLSIQGGSGPDRLIGPDSTNEWVIDQLNGGKINSRITFAGIENLTGGSGADTFKFPTWSSSINGSISGGSGSDTLDYTAQYPISVNVNLATGTASSIGGGVVGIENVTGGGAKDYLVGDSGVNVLRGGGGDDTLLGGAGNDYLFGEGGKDTLNGEGDNDYLDGGYDGSKDILRGDTGRDTFVTYYYRPYLYLPTYWLPEVEDTDFLSGEDYWSAVYVG